MYIPANVTRLQTNSVKVVNASIRSNRMCIIPNKFLPLVNLQSRIGKNQTIKFYESKRPLAFAKKKREKKKD